MKVVADANIPFVAEAFAEFGEVGLVSGRKLSAEQVRDADILLVRSLTPVGAALLDGSRARFVGTATSGVDHVDRNYLLHRGIAFASAPGSNARSVAEYVLSAVLVLMQERGRRLADATAAVIGCGQVGTRVAELLTAVGIRCLLNDPPLKEGLNKSALPPLPPGEGGGEGVNSIGDPLTLSRRERGHNQHFHDLDEVLSADIITLHVPLTTTGMHPTYRLIDDSVLSRLRPDAILINTARGGVVDEQALLRRFKQQPAMTAVVDCWADEPNINRELLAQVALGTPHIAGYSFDAKMRATEMLHRVACAHFGRTAVWHPPAQPSGGYFRCPESMSDEDILRRAALSCYDAREDSTAFKRVMAMRPEERGARFDALRRDYRQRREFCRYEVVLPAGRERMAYALRQIGFKVNQ